MSFELKGVLFLCILNPELKKFSILSDYEKSKHISAKLPPIYDKKKWKKGELSLKDNSPELAKQIMNETLKYTFNYNNIDEAVPFTLGFWFNGNRFSCEIEFNED